MSDWEKVGVVAVDAGVVWIGDPCFFLPRRPDMEKYGKRPTAAQSQEATQDWGKFCQWLENHTKEAEQMNFKDGQPGLGVVSHTLHGDGVYPVEIRKNEYGRVVELRVRFDATD